MGQGNGRTDLHRNHPSYPAGALHSSVYLRCSLWRRRSESRKRPANGEFDQPRVCYGPECPECGWRMQHSDRVSKVGNGPFVSITIMGPNYRCWFALVNLPSPSSDPIVKTARRAQIFATKPAMSRAVSDFGLQSVFGANPEPAVS